MEKHDTFSFTTPIATTERPWGNFTILADGHDTSWRVKVLRVRKGEELSLQTHRLRDEHWIILDGAVRATVGGGVMSLITGGRKFTRGDYIVVPRGKPHRLKALEDAIFCEVSIGDVHEEDEVRIEDSYGRVGTVNRDVN
ncbi:MAG: cupin domain-containing protein [Candidatus Yonathbacteria bacterium]|nr:cupin domain-containing protein [Candidatus Yonathbacteria bacterium]